MLNITTITRQRVDRVVDYYADGADDYYAKDGNAMQWQGAGAEELGLTGEVEQRKQRTIGIRSYVFRAERRFASGTGQR